MSSPPRNCSPAQQHWRSQTAPGPESLPRGASLQHQSPFFSALPAEVRRNIYRQLWLDRGPARHVLLLSPRSYLQSFPCVLGPGRGLGREPGPPGTPDADAAHDDDAAAAAAAAAEGADGDGGPGQPQPHDDPGDINGALQDLSGADTEQPADDDDVDDDTATAGGGPGPGTGTPWCAHHRCFRRWARRWGHSFSAMYTACYRRGGVGGVVGGGQVAAAGSPILAVLLVCKLVHAEAGESLFSSVRFSFAGLSALGAFVGRVPAPLVARVRFADIVTADVGFMPDEDAPVDNRTPAERVYDTVRRSFPSLRELRLTLHPTRVREPLPRRQDLEPLYALAREAGGVGGLRRFEVFLPAARDAPGGEVGRGGVSPSSLRDAPFAVRVVPPGWHELGDCPHFLQPGPVGLVS